MNMNINDAHILSREIEEKNGFISCENMLQSNKKRKSFFFVSACKECVLIKWREWEICIFIIIWWEREKKNEVEGISSFDCLV